MASKHHVSYAVRSTHVSIYFFYKFWSLLLCTFTIAPINNVALIKHRRLYHLMSCLLRVLLQLPLAWLQSAQLCCTTSCATKVWCVISLSCIRADCMRSLVFSDGLIYRKFNLPVIKLKPITRRLRAFRWCIYILLFTRFVIISSFQ